MKGVFDPSFLASRARGNLIVRDMIDRAAEACRGSVDPRQARGLRESAGGPAGRVHRARTRRDGRAAARVQTWLATGETELAIERLDDRSLLCASAAASCSAPARTSSAARTAPSRTAPWSRSTASTIQVEELTEDQRPAQIIARFDRSLDDPCLYFLRWDDLGYTRFIPPAIGERVRVPAVDLSRALLGDMFRLPIDGRLPRLDPHWDRMHR